MLCEKRAAGIYAPEYYKDFRCIADKCRHSCCIDWEICIDSATLEKYKNIPSVINTVTECDDGACFRLNDDGRCPHLNSDGLCNIIITHGEDHLSDICRSHPRFFNSVGGGCIEAGIGIVCEEACRIILENEEPFSLLMAEDDRIDSINASSADCDRGFDPIPERNRIISETEESGASFEELLNLLRASFGISDLYTENEWIDRFLSLEILDTGWERILNDVKRAEPDASGGGLLEYDKYYKRLLTYFVYRHVSIAESRENLRARLAFSILSVRMIRHLFEARGELRLDALLSLARLYSSEIEYSEDNTAELIFEFESSI